MAVSKTAKTGYMSHTKTRFQILSRASWSSLPEIIQVARMTLTITSAIASPAYTTSFEEKAVDKCTALQSIIYFFLEYPSGFALRNASAPVP